MKSLNLMLADMELADPLFKPTNFWESGLPSLIADIKRHGLKNLRAHNSAHVYYVPLYREKINPLEEEKLNNRIFPFLDQLGTKRAGNELRNILNGEALALNDYKLFLLSDKPRQSPILTHLSESSVGHPIEQFHFDGKKYSKSFLNYLRMLTFLKQRVDTSKIKTVFEIGGGFGTLGEIILKSDNEAFYVNVDIPPLSRISTYYLSQLFGKEQVLAYEDSRRYDVLDIERIRRNYRCAVICPWQLPKIKGNFDLFVNAISFQEMEPEVVRNYLRIVQKITKKFILLRNSKLGKKVAKRSKEMGVFKPTTSEMVIGMIDQFDLLGRDSFLFGFQNPKVNFYSEVMCFKRKKK